MALNCKLSERIFTFEGKDYSYAQFQALLAEGLLAKIPQLTQQAKAAITAPTAEPAPKGAVDASDIDAMEGLMSRHEGNNAEGVSKPKLIAKVLNGIRWLTNNNLGYDANTGKGNRIFVAESKAEYERITKDASGKAKTGGGVAIPRYDAYGNYMGADIYINLDTKSLGTVAHELAHVALMEKFAGDPKLFKKFVAAIKPFTSAKDLAYLDKFIRLYPDEEVRPEEFLAEMTALIEERFASGEVDAKELSALRKLAEAIKQFINKLTGGLVFPLEKESDVRAFFNALGQSIAVGGVMKEGLAEAAAREVGAKPEVAERREAVERKEDKQLTTAEVASRVEAKTKGGIVLPSMNLIAIKPIIDPVTGKKQKKGIEGIAYSGPADIKSIKENKPRMYISRAEEIAKSHLVKESIRKYSSNWSNEQKLAWADNVYSKAKEAVVSNLLFVHDAIDKDIRNISKLWYDGANVIAQDMAKQYGVTLEQASAVIATQSPQKPWFDNVHLAHFIIDFYTKNQQTIYEQSDYDYFESKSRDQKGRPYPAQVKNLPKLKEAIGKKFSELNDYDKSAMIRARFDQQYERMAPLRLPTGALTGTRVKGKSSFSGYDTIAKAVSVLGNGSKENISKNLGDAFKVRNFYNNIASPQTDGEVTIDTHAMAAAYLLPLGSSSKEVQFDEATYAFFADAYRDAASKRGILAREMQSITWEGVRALFPANKKSEKAKQVVRDIWADYVSGKISLSDVHNKVSKHGEDPSITDWSGGIAGMLDPSRTPSYLGELSLVGGNRLATGQRDEGSGLGGLPAVEGPVEEAGRAKPRREAVERKEEGVESEEKATFAADEKARAAQEAKEDVGRRVPSRSFSVDPATRGEDFYKAIREASRRHKLGRAVDVKDKEFYTSAGTKLFLAGDATAGVAVTDYGDLVSVFKAPGSSADINELLAQAAEESKTLDAFDINGFLPDLYAKHGFVPVARVPFNEQYAPEGWPYEIAGKPDVVLMVRDTEGVLGVAEGPYSSIKKSIPSFESYDDAMAAQAKASEKVSAAAKPRREAMERKEDEAFNGIEDPKTPIGDTKAVVVNGVERTVFNSEGRPIHPTVEGVRNFWRWFGESKVVDAEGRPLVVYHGSPIAGTEVFDPEEGGKLVKTGLARYGTYFTDNTELASEYAAGRRREDGVTTEQSVYPVYLKIDNPVEVNGGFGTFGDWVEKLNINIGYKTAWGFDALQVLAGKNSWVGKNPTNDGLIVKNTADIEGGTAEKRARLMGTMYATFRPNQIKSATGNYGRFDPKRREIMERKEGVRDIPADAEPETRELLTVVRRRVEKIEGDEKRAKERDVLLGRPANYIEPGDYKAAVDQARDFVAEMYFKYADLPLSKWGKAVYNEIQSITNEASRVVAFGELHAALDMAADSRKISAKDRKEIADLAAKIVGEMATEAREMGKANAALAIVYSQFGKFSSLVQAEKINQEFKAKLQTTPGSEPGKSIADNIQEARDEVNEFINKDGNEDLADVIDVAEEVNDAMEDIHAEQVAAGKSTPLDAPDPVSAFDFIDNSAIYEEIISELEEELARLNGKLSIVTKLYGQATQQASAYAKQIADLRSEMAKREKLIERLKKQKEKISKERDKYKAKAETLKQKVADLKNINKLLAASKLSTQRKNKLINELIELAASGKLNDPDFDSVFAAITKNNYLTTQDRKAIEHMARAMKYFEKTGQTELGQKYAKRLNEYLANVSKEPWNTAKVAMLLQSWFYNDVLSSIGTLHNAFVGSILVTVPNATAASIATALNNPKSGLGATLYGMIRMLKEMPTAISKGAFNQRAYDSMGTSWTVDNASTYADPFEVHILNGFFKHWDRIKNDPSAVEKMKASVALLGSMVAQATRIVGLLKFIDPVLRHSVAAHLEGMRDYIRIKEELRLQKDTDPSIAEAWTPYFSISLINKIDEMAKVSRKDRSNAASQAAEEIEQMESEGISIPKDYARRRTSEIMRAKRDQEQALVADKMAADMTMMWRPDGVLGYVWDSTSKSMSIRETDKPLKALIKLLANLTFLPFLRISAQGVSDIQSTIPIWGSLMAAYGVAKNNEGGWYVGYKGAKNVNDRKFEMQRMARRIVLNGISTLIIGGLLAHMFEIEAADDDDDEAYDLFGKKVKIKLNPDRLIDFTADARGPKSKNEGIMEGRANFSLRVRPNSKSDFSDYVSVRLAPHMTILVAWLGRLSDDVNRLYAQPAFGKGEQPERATAYDYFVNQPLTALGEVSFATIPRFYNTLKYDAGAAVARMLMSPVAAIAQPSIYRDVVSTTASMAGATKKGEYMPEGFAETSKALFTTMYGLNYMVSPEMTDEYGLPLKAVDPIRNWWKGFTDIEKRSDDYPEVNLRYRYGNTFTPATPRAQRLESVDRIVKKGEKGLISPKLELTKEQQQESSMMSKAFYRYMTLKNYDKIVSAAEMAKKRKGKGAFPGEIVGEALEKIHNKAIGQTEKMFTLYANDKKSRDEIVNLINKLNSKSDSMSTKIKERGPLPSPENMVQLYKGDAIDIDFELE